MSGQDGRVIDKVEGADAAAVTRMVQKHCPQSQDASSKAGSIAPSKAFSNGSAPHGNGAPSKQSLEQRVQQLISAEPIMLFMKAGSPSSLPDIQCKQSLLELKLYCAGSSQAAHRSSSTAKPLLMLGPCRSLYRCCKTL